jgi:hypothetical protein
MEYKGGVKQFLLLLGWGCLLVWGAAARAQTDPALQEPGVLYLQGNVPEKVTALVKAPTTVYTQRNFQIVAGAFYPGQTIEIVGSSADGFIVKGQFRNNTVTGWIRPQDLPTGFDPRILQAAQHTQERRDSIAVAITNKTVVRGMTPDEVRQAVGRPDQTATRTDATGSTLTWIFTTYEEQPQYNYTIDPFGRPVLQTYYVKIPIGQLIVGFGNGVVSTIEEHKTDPNSPGVVTN